jgi:magnesium transporter
MDSELEKLAAQFGFDEDLLDDGVDLYESPRLEHEDKNIYIYTRYCHPAGVHTSTEPLLLIITPTCLVTVARRDPEPIIELIQKVDTITTQKIKLVLLILESVNEGYRRHLNAVTKQILSSRNRLQKTIVDNNEVLKFIDMEEDLNEFLAALQPYGILLHALLNGRYLKLHEEDEDLIEDLQLSTSELIELTKSRLKTIQNMRDAYSTIATNNLNKVFKQLTSIAIFMSIPTIIGGLYGMNIALPFDHHPQAFFIVLGAILLLVLSFIYYFRKKRWL